MSACVWLLEHALRGRGLSTARPVAFPLDRRQKDTACLLPVGQATDLFRAGVLHCGEAAAVLLTSNPTDER